MAKRKETRNLGHAPLESDAPIEGDRNTDIEKGDDKFLADARIDLAGAHSFWRPIQQLASDDIEFIYGEQWDEAELARRRKQRRPALTLNVQQSLVANVRGAALETQFSANVQQRSGVFSILNMEGQGGRTLSLAEVMEGLIRDSDQSSNARQVHANALQHTVEGGFGFYRIHIERDPYDPFSMCLRSRFIHDRFSVLFDPHAREDDLSDAESVAISKPFARSKFRALWPEARADGFDFKGSDFEFKPEYIQWWGPDDEVRVLDIYKKEPMERIAVQLVRKNRDGKLVDLPLFLDDIEEIYDDLIQRHGFTEEDRMKLKTYKIRMRRCTSMDVLEGPRDFPAMRLPVIPVFGRRVDTRSKRLYIGAARYSKDAQRMHNYWASAATERVGQAIKTKILVGTNQLSGNLEDDWEEAHLVPQIYLKYDDTDNQRPPSVVNAVDMPGAELAMMSVGTQAIRDTTGVHEAEQGKPSNERSGKAIQERQAAGRATYAEYVEKLAAAVGSGYQLMCELFPRIYKSERLMRIVLPEGSEAQVRINHKVVDEATGLTHIVAPIGLARFHCFAEAGPLYSTQLDKFLNLMLEWGKNDPQSIVLTRDLIVLMMQIPGGKAVAMRFKHMLPRHILTPEEQRQIPEPQPTPEQQVEMAKAKGEMAKAKATVAAAEASKLKAQADMKMQGDRMKQSQFKLLQEEIKTMRERMDQGGEVNMEQIEKMVEKAARELFAEEWAKRS